jgi:hypothetical protein
MASLWTRQQGNTVFVDEQFKPYADQWSFLAALGKISRLQVEALVRDAEAKGRIIGVSMAVPDEEEDRPWTAPPSRRYQPPILEARPESLELVLGDQIYIARENLPPRFEIVCFAWRRFRTLNSIVRNRCACRRTESRGSSIAQKSIHCISPSLAAVSTK